MTKTQLKSKLSMGQKLLELTKLSEKSAFYDICAELGMTGSVTRNKGKAGWTAVVTSTYVAATTPEVQPLVGKPTYWMAEAPVTPRGVAVVKFLRSSEQHEWLPLEWYSLCEPYNVIVQPAFSQKPLACLYQITYPHSMQVSDPMLAYCPRAERQLGWTTTIARSLWSLGNRSLTPDHISLGWDRLQELSPATPRSEYDEAVAIATKEVANVGVKEEL